MALEACDMQRSPAPLVSIAHVSTVLQQHLCASFLATFAHLTKSKMVPNFKARHKQGLGYLHVTIFEG